MFIDYGEMNIFNIKDVIFWFKEARDVTSMEI